MQGYFRWVGKRISRVIGNNNDVEALLYESDVAFNDQRNKKYRSRNNNNNRNVNVNNNNKHEIETLLKVFYNK